MIAQIIHVGSNLPCVKLPGLDPSEHSNVQFQYGDTSGVIDKSCGVGAKIIFTVSYEPRCLKSKIVFKGQ